MDSKEPVKSSHEPEKKLHYDSDSEGSRHTNEDDLLDIDVEPTYILDCISNLSSVSEATVTSLSFLKDMDPSETLESLYATFHELYSKLCDLEEIAASYAAVSEPTACDADRYIDPSIIKWLGDCMLCLLATQALVDEQLDRRSKELSQVDGLNMDALSLEESTIDAEDGQEGDSWLLLNKNNDSIDQLAEHDRKLTDMVDRIAGALPAFAA
jgi:hypothetical protein